METAERSEKRLRGLLSSTGLRARSLGSTVSRWSSDGRELTLKKEDEICTSSFSSSTIPLTSGIEEAPQLLLSVVLFYHIFLTDCNPPAQPFHFKGQVHVVSARATRPHSLYDEPHLVLYLSDVPQPVAYLKRVLLSIRSIPITDGSPASRPTACVRCVGCPIKQPESQVTAVIVQRRKVFASASERKLNNAAGC